jgi:hypothetical protein
MNFSLSLSLSLARLLARVDSTSFCYRRERRQPKQLKINIFIAFLSDHFSLSSLCLHRHRIKDECEHFFFSSASRCLTLQVVANFSEDDWKRRKKNSHSPLHATLITNFSIFTTGMLMIDHNLHISAHPIYLSNELWILMGDMRQNSCRMM